MKKLLLLLCSCSFALIVGFSDDIKPTIDSTQTNSEDSTVKLEKSFDKLIIELEKKINERKKIASIE